MPNCSITTDVIVGFPGETEKDFQRTINLVEEVGFDESFSFIYSARPNTPAKDMDDDVPISVKKRRLGVLQNILKRSAQSIGRRMVGNIERCLVTGISKRDPGEFQSRTENNKVVNFSSSDPDILGKFINLEIVESLPNSLRGIITL